MLPEVFGEPSANAGARERQGRTAGYSALADCTAGGADHLKALVDIIRSEQPWLSRQAVVTALTNWLARDAGNTALLYGVFIGKSITPRPWLLGTLTAWPGCTLPAGAPGMRGPQAAG